MMHRIYAIYDSKVEAYLQPFFMPTHGAAMRMMEDMVADRGHAFHKHAADYHLFYIGSWYDDNCTFTVEEPESICSLIELKKDRANG